MWFTAVDDENIVQIENSIRNCNALSTILLFAITRNAIPTFKETLNTCQLKIW